MFCIKCGTQIDDSAAFCPSCGQALNTNSNLSAAAPAMDYSSQMQMAQQMQAQQFQLQKNAIRQSEIDSINKVYNHFNLKRSAFEEYDKVGATLNHYLKGARSALIVWGAIITCISFLLAVAALDYEGTSIFWVSVLIGLAMIAGGIMMKVNNKRKCKLYEAEYTRLAQELNDHYYAYPMCPIGAEYSNPEINQVEMNMYLQNIANYSQSTAAAARTTAVFAAASFFTKL